MMSQRRTWFCGHWTMALGPNEISRRQQWQTALSAALVA
jgi:hypothetical protein